MQSVTTMIKIRRYNTGTHNDECQLLSVAFYDQAPSSSIDYYSSKSPASITFRKK
jgi:hypothetical protein